MVLIYFLEVTDPHGGPHPLWAKPKSMNFSNTLKGWRPQFLSDPHQIFSVKYPQHTELLGNFSETESQNFSSASALKLFNGSWKKSDLLNVIYISEF